MSTASALFAATSPTKLKSRSSLPEKPVDVETAVSADSDTGGSGDPVYGEGYEKGKDIENGNGNENGNGDEYQGGASSTSPAASVQGATRPGTATAAILAKARAASANARALPGRQPSISDRLNAVSNGSSSLGDIKQAPSASGPTRPPAGRSFGSSSSTGTSIASTAPATSPPTVDQASGGGGAGSSSFFGAVASPPRPSSAQSGQGSLRAFSPPTDGRGAQGTGPGTYAESTAMIPTSSNGNDPSVVSSTGGRVFGERARSPPDGGTGAHTNTSPTRTPSPSFPFKPPTTRARSGSSLSVTSTTSLDALPAQMREMRAGINLNAIQNNLQNLATGAVGAVGQADREAFFAAADKATTWLSGWAPKGEGRSREFLKGTWSGIGNVAGAVGGAVGEIGRGGRLAGPGQGGGGGGGGMGESRPDSPEVVPGGSGYEGETAGRVFGSAEGMQRTNSAGGRVFGAGPSTAPAQAPATLGGRKILQPANLRRLGRSSSIGKSDQAPDDSVAHAPPPVQSNIDHTPLAPSLNASTSSLSLSTSDLPRVISTSPTPTATRPSALFPTSTDNLHASGSATRSNSTLGHAQPALHTRRSSAQTPTGSSKMTILGRPRAQSRPGMPPSASTSALAPRLPAGDATHPNLGQYQHQGSPNALSLSASPGSGQYLAMAASASTGPHGSSHLNPNVTAGTGMTGMEGDSAAQAQGQAVSGSAGQRGTGRYRHGHSNSYSGIGGAGAGLGLPGGAAGQRRAPSFGAASSLASSAVTGPGTGVGAAQGWVAPGMSATSSASAASDSSKTKNILNTDTTLNRRLSKVSRSGSTSLTPSARPSYHQPRPSSSSAYSGGASPAFGPASTSSTPTVMPMAMGMPRATTSTSISGLASNVAATPYKIGFQPAGVKSDRSEEFARARKKAGEGREREEGRLGRRWAKLVDLHFNPNTQMPTMRRSDSSSSIDSASTAAPVIPPLGRSVSGASSPSRQSLGSTNTALGQRPAPVPLPRSSSSRLSLMSVENLSLRPNAVWKGLKAAAATPQQAEESRKRVEEQGIVKWEEDGSAKRCRICQALFSLSNRKHHCRLCGRLVCSLPPTNPALLAVQMQLFPPASPDVDSAPTDVSKAAPTAALNASTTLQSSTNPSTDEAALPAGTRREKCSILLVADYKTGRGEEVEEGFVGWMKLDEQGQSAPASVPGGQKQGHVRTLSRASSIAGSDSTRGTANTGLGRIRQDESDVNGGQATPIKQQQQPLPQQPREVQVKGVRVCRECWGVVSRQQKMQDRQRVSGFARLYAALRTMQAEIEEVMLDFEGQMDLLTSHPTPPDPPTTLLKVHKSLLVLFTQFEALSKRVTSIPSKEGGSQATVQAAVARSAAVFLAKEMAKVQALPRLQKMMAAEKRKSMGVGLRVVERNLSDLDGNGDGGEEERGRGKGEGVGERELAEMLQPLLEQEAQLEQYISDANAQRKYDDGRALTEALNEIKAEIGRVMASAI